MIIREKVRVGDQLVTLETGRIAKQAGGSCLVRAGDTGNDPGQAQVPAKQRYLNKER